MKLVENNTISKRSINSKNFDYLKYPQRRIALLFLYYGWEFDGLVTQKNTFNTVEEHLLNALIKTRLIRDRDSCQWTRCGRTDKGVSAFKQVVAVTVRSNDVSAKDIFWLTDNNINNRIQNTCEHNFTKMLNGVLPKTICVLGWCPVEKNFNARFNCTERTYNYIFPRGNVNIKKINDAGKLLVGIHDFRNFCHIDNNENRLKMSYIREIFNVNVEELLDNVSKNNRAFDLLKLTVKASGFLWHQIRCIVTILYEIGCEKEEVEIIATLLNINITPARPQYGLANELPLCLFDCNYANDCLKWIFDSQSFQHVLENLQKHWAEYQVKAAIIKSMINGLIPMVNSTEETVNSINGLNNFTLNHAQTKNYIPILKRPCCDSLEKRRCKKKEK